MRKAYQIERSPIESKILLIFSPNQRKTTKRHPPLTTYNSSLGDIQANGVTPKKEIVTSV